jgi:hypothetical protein
VQHVVIFNLTLTWILFLLAVDQVLCTVHHQVTSTNDPQTGSVLRLVHIRPESNDIHVSKPKNAEKRQSCELQRTVCVFSNYFPCYFANIAGIDIRLLYTRICYCKYKSHPTLTL